ncbi:MAG: phosphatidate cytidylyltransferase [Gammaproteobacteria bacterium]|nr:phosphatidate cytidylyltransferase [Gammaproteobacteria bacterium]
MLKQRLLTAAILIPLVIFGIFALPTLYLSLILLLIVSIGAWEWAALINLKKTIQRAAYVGVVIIFLAAAACIAQYPAGLKLILWVALFWWLVALVWVFRFRENEQHTPILWVNGLVGILVLVPCWVALTMIHKSEQGAEYLLFVMSLIWIADSGAYFSGRRWGKNKLAPHVSPGKSWEGVIGGLVFVAIAAVIGGGLLFEYEAIKLLLFVLLCIVIVLFSVEGDLLESMFKRRAGVKDSGTILPGHGGVLDRIDSLTAAAPLFLLGLLAGDFIS